MSQTTAPTLPPTAKPQPTSLPNAWARRIVLAKMSRFTKGHLTIEDGEQVCEFGREDDPLSAHVRVIDPRFYRYMALGGSLGAAEAYIDGLWETDDLTALCRIVVRRVHLTLEAILTTSCDFRGGGRGRFISSVDVSSDTRPRTLKI